MSEATIRFKLKSLAILSGSLFASSNVARAEEAQCPLERQAHPFGILLQRTVDPNWLKRNAVAEYLKEASRPNSNSISRGTSSLGERDGAPYRQLPKYFPPDISNEPKNDPTKLGKRKIYGGRKAVEDFVHGKSKNLRGYDAVDY